MNAKFTIEQAIAHQRKHGFGPVIPSTVMAKAKVEGRILPSPAGTVELNAVKEGPKLNKTEARFYEIIKARHPAPSVIRIMPVRFILGHDNTYNPDFMVSDGPNLRILFYEIKGAMIWPKNFIKFKTAARMFPEFTWILAQWKNNTWTETQYK